MGGDEISCGKFYSNTFTMRVFDTFTWYFSGDLFKHELLLYFLVKYKLLVSWFSPPLSDINIFCWSMLITAPFQGTGWAGHNPLPKPVPVQLSGAVKVLTSS